MVFVLQVNRIYYSIVNNTYETYVFDIESGSEALLYYIRYIRT